jgi:hypothetical protein
MLVSAGDQDGFLSKWDTDGNFMWAAHLASGPGDVALPGELRVDQEGNPLLTFTFNGTADFDPSSAVAHLTSSDQTDGAIVKLNADGTFGWAVQMSGPGITQAESVVVDSEGNVYSSGFFQHGVSLPNGEMLTNSAGNGTFLMKMLAVDLPAGAAAVQNEAIVPEPSTMLLVISVICAVASGRLRLKVQGRGLVARRSTS